MSHFQQQDAMSTLDFENLMVTQRRLLKDMSPSSTANAVAKSSGEEQEWISNWQFERIAPTKKPQGITSVPKSVNTKRKSDSPVEEGGVYYFQRIHPNYAAPAVSSNQSNVSVTDTDNAVASQATEDNKKNDFDQEDFFLDMTIDNDDLFADLEAAADSNDDSEISLDELMDMEMDDDQDRNQSTKFMRSLNMNQDSGLQDVNDFLNKSNSANIMSDGDFEMMTNDDDANAYSFSSPITSKETVSSSMAFGASPTSVAQHRMAPSAPPLLPSGMSTASTRPALQQMRKMMTELMDQGAIPRQRNNSRLPCAEGMDEMYLDTLRKLSASMERSKKTRTSLSIPMQTMQSSANYSRSMCVNQILQSVQTSSRHVDTCLRSVSMMSR
jgi:hypothetical protein